MKELPTYLIFYMSFFFFYSLACVLISEEGPEIMGDKSFYIEGLIVALISTVIFILWDRKYYNKWN